MARDGALCKGTKLDGAPCRAWAKPSTGYCIAHDPARRDKAQAARSKAGRVTASKNGAPWAAVSPDDVGAPPKDRAELRDLVAKTINWTLTGALDPKRADAVIKLAKNGMQLFPEAKEPDPWDQLEDPELYEALLKDIRAVEQRLVRAGHFDGDRWPLLTDKHAGEVVAKSGNGKPEQWPEVKE